MKTSVLIARLQQEDPDSDVYVEAWSPSADRWVLVDLDGVFANPTSPSGYLLSPDNPVEEDADYGFHHDIGQSR